MAKFKFAPASRGERIVFGARRPGYSSRSVDESQVRTWLSFMVERGIKRVCCLLSQKELGYYQEDLLQLYREEFGEDKVCWAPVEDYHLVQRQLLVETILPFLRQSDEQGEPAVVHCSGGVGRTGHVLAAWLAVGLEFPVEKALSAVCETGRNPFEAIHAGNARTDELLALLDKQ